MDITVQELKNKLAAEDGFVLIDVREPYEHEEFNVGGNLVPLGDIPNRLGELEDFKDHEIIVYCRSGKRSANAQAFLQQNGFQNVHNLTGGMLAWEEAFGRTR
jgi:rhodanese-related sulfurtransferase